jgi:Flp pilus assembly pilin Flp
MRTSEARKALKQIVQAAFNGRPGAAFRRLISETDGQDLIEYALLTTFIGFAGAAAWNAMQTALGNFYDSRVDAVWLLWEPDNPVGGGS